MCPYYYTAEWKELRAKFPLYLSNSLRPPFTSHISLTWVPITKFSAHFTLDKQPFTSSALLPFSLENAVYLQQNYEHPKIWDPWPFIHLFSKYPLITYNVPGTVLGPWDTLGNITDKALCLVGRGRGRESRQETRNIANELHTMSKDNICYEKNRAE